MKNFKSILIFIYLLLSLTFYSQNVTVKNGYNKFYYENGKVSSEGNMKDGSLDGYWKNYYENGKLKIEGNRKDHLLDSTWKFYDNKGKITKSIFYKAGRK